jgi:hypothetical protein
MNLPMNVEFTLGNMHNVVILEVKHPLYMLNDGASITRDEELDRLSEAILGYECPRLGPEQLLTLGSRRLEMGTRMAGEPGY